MYVVSFKRNIVYKIYLIIRLTGRRELHIYGTWPHPPFKNSWCHFESESRNIKVIVFQNPDNMWFILIWENLRTGILKTVLRSYRLPSPFFLTPPRMLCPEIFTWSGPSCHSQSTSNIISSNRKCVLKLQCFLKWSSTSILSH